MTRFSIALCGLVLAAVSSVATRAETLDFNFSFTSGNGIAGEGSFTAVSDGTNRFLIDSILGTSDTGNGVNQKIAGLIAPLGFGPNDDLLLFSPVTDTFSLDGSGVSYALGNGAEIELFGAGAKDGVFLERNNGAEVSQAADITIAETPEPPTLALSGIGAVALAAVVRRRRGAARFN
jgi:hypothetical protein